MSTCDEVIDCYLGSYEHAIDAQRRLVIPQDWRGRPQDNPLFYMMHCGDGIIQVMPKEIYLQKVWRPLEERCDPMDRRLTRAMAKLAAQTSFSNLDKQGRLTLTKELLQAAGIQEKVVLSGALRTFQVCTPEKWQELQDTEWSGDLDYLHGVISAALAGSAGLPGPATLATVPKAV